MTQIYYIAAFARDPSTELSAREPVWTDRIEAARAQEALRRICEWRGERITDNAIIGSHELAAAATVHDLNVFASSKRIAGFNDVRKAS